MSRTVSQSFTLVSFLCLIPDLTCGYLSEKHINQSFTVAKVNDSDLFFLFFRYLKLINCVLWWTLLVLGSAAATRLTAHRETCPLPDVLSLVQPLRAATATDSAWRGLAGRPVLSLLWLCLPEDLSLGGSYRHGYSVRRELAGLPRHYGPCHVVDMSRRAARHRCSARRDISLR